MTVFTVFYRHPYHLKEGGHYVVDRPTAEIAGTEAADMLPEDLWPDEDPEEIDLTIIRDELEVAVYEGAHTAPPDGPPAYEFT